MARFVLQGVVYTKNSLDRFKKEEFTVISDTIGMGQVIKLEKNVLCNWHLKEELEGIFTLEFEFHEVTKTHNLLSNFATYEIQRDANGAARVVRISAE